MSTLTLVWLLLLNVSSPEAPSISAVTDASLIPLSGPDGTAMLLESMSETTLELLTQYEIQENPAYCGAASAVMVLNAAGVPAPQHPTSPSYRYFTQSNVFSAAVEECIGAEHVRQRGFTLNELAYLLRSWNLDVRVIHGRDITVEGFRELIRTAMHDDDQFVIVGFSRPRLGQLGTGHYSPVAAYHAGKDAIAILDVARYKEEPFWVPTHVLWEAVNTDDATGCPRGLIIAQPKPHC